MEQNTSNYLFQGTGRRKNAVARVNIVSGTGKISINKKTVDEYFGGLEKHKKQAIYPTTLFPAVASFDFRINVVGGGVTGQSGAIRHSLARAILKSNPDLKSSFRKEGLLTRDDRMVERKKPGRPKARKRFQFSKR
jgi:small subunit ribosomal protein S9